MRRIHSSMSLLIGAVLIGCAGLPPPPPVPTARKVPTPSGLADDAPAPPVMLPGDMLTVELHTQPPARIEALEVDATGYLHVPGLGDVPVGGATLQEAQRRIQVVLQERDRLGRVTLYVTAGAGRRITVLGAVTRPGSYAVRPGMRLSDAVAAAGGPRTTPSPADGTPIPLADLQGAVLARRGRPLPVSLPRALQGAPGHNVLVRAADHLYVPYRERPVVSVLGQVNAPASLPHWDGMRMTEALALAAGVTPDGDRSDIRLVRGAAHQPVVYSASLTAVVDGRGHDVALAPGDVLFVTDEAHEDLREVLDLLAPLVGLASTAILLVAFGAL